jgi:exonuclease III
MRLATWNACRGKFSDKAHYLDYLQADVAVIQEIARPLQPIPNVLWFGSDPNQGVAVVTRHTYTAKQLPGNEDVPNYVIPVEIIGPHSFLLFAVWTLKNEPFKYVQAASTAIQIYEPLFAGRDVVMLGDFNSNAIWDNDHPAELNHSAMVNNLDRLGLVSAYHQFNGEFHGNESVHTYYHQWNRSQGFHIDYCFLPKSWGPAVKAVDVGSFAAWQKSSDHRPLLVDLQFDT